ncbi:MAG: hypothetical protein WC859_00790 [Elusimicrobiota bacterium]|jgi:hypothetical protein
MKSTLTETDLKKKGIILRIIRTKHEEVLVTRSEYRRLNVVANLLASEAIEIARKRGELQ